MRTVERGFANPLRYLQACNSSAKLDITSGNRYVVGMTGIDPRTIALGQEIRAEAAAQRLTIAELSVKASVPRSSLYTWLDGKANFPLDGLVRIADALGVSPHVLLHRGEDRARRTAREV